MTPAASLIASIVKSIKGYSFAYTNEDELQRGIDRVFQQEDVSYEREFRLSDKDRLDFFVHSSSVASDLRTGIAIEVKIDGTLTDLTRQVHRYMQDDLVEGVVVVTPKMRLARMPEEMNGKPLGVALLSSSAF